MAQLPSSLLISILLSFELRVLPGFCSCVPIFLVNSSILSGVSAILRIKIPSVWTLPCGTLPCAAKIHIILVISHDKIQFGKDSSKTI